MGGSKSCVVSAGFDERCDEKRLKLAAERVKKKKKEEMETEVKSTHGQRRENKFLRENK